MITYEYVIQRKSDGKYYKGPGFVKSIDRAFRWGTWPAANGALRDGECVVKVKLTWSVEAVAMDSECN